MPLLFSYGTLQKEQVQIETFGRKLEGTKDLLAGYRLDFVEITDPEVLRKSGQKHHPILQFSGNSSDSVAGVLFELTEQEILQADAYEVADYKRVEATLCQATRVFCMLRNSF